MGFKGLGSFFSLGCSGVQRLGISFRAFRFRIWV